MLTLKKMYFWVFLAYIAILPFSHTTVLRNLLLMFLIVNIAAYIFFEKKSLKSYIFYVPVGLRIWIIFLLIFPFFSEDVRVAWQNILGHLGQGAIAWLIGLFSFLILKQFSPNIFTLGVASFSLLAFYFIQLIFSWMDVGSFPWGFRGYDPDHGNLGAAAAQCIVLFMVSLMERGHFSKRLRIIGSLILIALSFLSLIIASSRGSLIFSFLILIISVAFIIWRFLRFQSSKIIIDFKAKKYFPFAIVIVICFLGWMLLFSLGKIVNKDDRWLLASYKVQTAMQIKNPTNVVCYGLTDIEQSTLEQQIPLADPRKKEEVMKGLRDDGGRWLNLLTGLELVVENPMGLDGSRQAFAKLLARKCNQPPLNGLDHAHSGWVNLTLSLGWVGLLLFIGLLARCAWRGYVSSKNLKVQAWALALCLLAIFWLMRGLVDAVYQDHYLQMQGVLLGYLWERIRGVEV